MAFFLFFRLFVLQGHCEIAFLASGIDTLDVEHGLLAGRGFLHDILQVVDGLDTLIVNLLDDEALRYAFSLPPLIFITSSP